MPNIAEIWNIVTESLQATIPETEYRTWFSRVKLARLDSEEAVIEVPSKFHARWLQEKYTTHIEGCLRRYLLSSPSIRFLQEKVHKQGCPPLAGSGVASPASSGIRKDLTFDSLAPNKENRFALAAAQKLATSGNTDYSPLFVYGARSLGKTHLLHAIGNCFIETWPGAPTVYLSAKAFSSRCISAFHRGTLMDFLEGLKAFQLLLFDDVHLLSGQYKVQMELISLMDAFQELNKQMVFASKRPPSQLEGFDGQLTSRLQSGVMVEMQVPDQDSKLILLKKRFGKDLNAVPDDVLFYLASTTDDSHKLIESAVRLLSFSSVQKRTFDISTAKALLKNRLGPQPDLEEIQKAVASYFNLSLADLISDKKKRAFVYPRQVAMYLCRNLTRLSYKEIGKAFGNRDHSSVMYAVERIQKEKSESQRVQNDVNHLHNFLG